MTEQEWLAQVKTKQQMLEDFILSWHPAYPAMERSEWDSRHGLQRQLPITAPNAEGARLHVLETFKHEEGPTANPLQNFRTALANKDTGEIMSILNKAWFGVPESTACWGIPGFAEAVNLLEDPPDPPEKGLEEADERRRRMLK